MANCNKLFMDFCKEITPSQEEMQIMKTSRQALEKKITEKIKDKLGVTPSYYTQGSGAHGMKTIIIKEDGTYDVDRGVYLPEKPDVTPETVQSYVYDAVKNHTDGGAEHRKKCIRVFYKCAYNIDFPVYYQVDGETYSYLAIKGDGWIKDDPEQMIKWFKDYKDSDGQLIRVIKYLKAWASKCSFKTPSGIALAVWAAKNFVANTDRDDKCLLDVLKGIRNACWWSVSCISPVEPFDDLTAKLNEDQKTKFKSALDSFIAGAELAVSEENQLIASKEWKKYLGERFPEGLDENVDKRLSSLLSTAATVLSNTARLDKLGVVNQSSGVPHQTHRNYGS
ncbi:cyclic GMP-AMP synthase DncV-like nucleotidyltransferase [Flaviaesturariibacter amylovorans]|uniref:Cyclic GMP-AMP synthase n=1 Tax=Flaviaesturariibacter amylovorans TaxID=1084520 RepID=A0ABP8H610_9BACT